MLLRLGARGVRDRGIPVRAAHPRPLRAVARTLEKETATTQGLRVWLERWSFFFACEGTLDAPHVDCDSEALPHHCHQRTARQACVPGTSLVDKKHHIGIQLVCTTRSTFARHQGLQSPFVECVLRLVE